MKETLVEKIVDLEWEMFQKTQNAGGRAWCQDDRFQFDTNRKGQFFQWDEKTLQLYLKDLEDAQLKGQNPVSLKYAYMMESTWPDEFLQIREKLPEIGEEKTALIRNMTEQMISWCEEFEKKYPNLAKRSRPIHKSNDGNGVTSVETYFKGELSTYSLETLNSLLAVYESFHKNEKNFYEMSVETQMKLAYGKTLDEVEKMMQ